MDETPNVLEPAPAELRMTLQITRAVTGKTETVEVVATPLPQSESTDVGDAQHSIS